MKVRSMLTTKGAEMTGEHTIYRSRCLAILGGFTFKQVKVSVIVGSCTLMMSSLITRHFLLGHLPCTANIPSESPTSFAEILNRQIARKGPFMKKMVKKERSPEKPPFRSMQLVALWSPVGWTGRRRQSSKIVVIHDAQKPGARGRVHAMQKQSES